jgi:hypothetical protein
VNPIDLVYLDSIGSMLDRLAAERIVATATGASERAGELQRHIDELTARRERVAQRLFGLIPVAAD